MKPDNEYRHWVVFMTAKGSSKEVARYRRRGDAESHRQALARLLPDGCFIVISEEPELPIVITEGIEKFAMLRQSYNCLSRENTQ